ncbi:related to DUF636 domain protein [Cephalotrichum gorgonifer]|uniref:Related to DUF636 domain protein n=1 Tax=Cephalotrichum gorgonifer TaxID=2041049 RepID=A0AAE8N1X1_9PEZI|nr:related to DUF636 domain protein [Cephalotrichum gorgonifer]
MAEKLHLPPERPEASDTLTAKCYCGAVQYTLTLPAHALPLPVHLCYCTICRYTHGALSSVHASLPAGITPSFVAPSSVETALTGYIHAEAVSERFFCSTCGCHVGDVALKPDADGNKVWTVATSIFDRHDEAFFQIRSHIHTDSSPSGGFYDWLPSIAGREIVVNKGPTPRSPSPADKTPPKAEVDEEGNERLRAECHCGGVSFTLPRPTIPAIANDPHISKYISPVDPSKWVGILDVCDDCRLVTGTHVVPWTFVPAAHLSPPVPPDLKIGTMKTYPSSEGILRGFCGVCGATALYFTVGRAPTEEQRVVDLAVGILRAPEGPLAEDWLTWRTGRIAYLETGKKFDAGFAESLSKNFDAWGVEKTPHTTTMKPASTTPTALVLIDIQHGFEGLPGFPTSWSTPSFEKNIVALLKAARAYNERSPDRPILIIHVHHHSLLPQSVFHPSYKLPSGIPGVEPLAYAAPLPSEPVLTKNHNSAFVGTDLEDRLRAFGAKQLILAGLTTDHCVCTTARFAANLQVLGDQGGADGSGLDNHGIVFLSDATSTHGKGKFSAEAVHEVHLAGLDEEFVQVQETEAAISAIVASP